MVRYAHGGLCPMPYALCPMPYALCPMHVGYLMLLRKVIDYTAVVSPQPVMAKPYSYHLGQKVMQAIELDSLQKSLCQ